MRKPMSTDMAKIYNSHNFIPREMVTLLNGCFSTLPACEIFHNAYRLNAASHNIMRKPDLLDR